MGNVAVRGALVVLFAGMAAAIAAPARAQADSTGSSALVLERPLLVPDPCVVGATIRFKTKIVIREATDAGVSLQSVKLRVRLESEDDKTAGTDVDLRGEAEANYLTLVSNSSLGQQYSLPLTAELSTDTTSELVRTPYGAVLYDVAVNLDPAAKETVAFRAVSSSCAGP